MRERVEECYSYRSGATLVLLVALALLLSSCLERGSVDQGNEGAEDVQENTSEYDPGSVTLEELLRRPERFYGQPVALNGKVERTISANAFAITSDEATQSDETFETVVAVVVGDEGSVPGLSEGQSVKVSGEANPFTREEIEQELNVNLDSSLYQKYENNPAIILGDVEILAGGETDAQ